MKAHALRKLQDIAAADLAPPPPGPNRTQEGMGMDAVAPPSVAATGETGIKRTGIVGGSEDKVHIKKSSLVY